MGKIKIRYLVFVLYMALIVSLFVITGSLSRYISGSNPQADFEVGDQIYFNYQRSSLFRNDNLIIGVEVDDEEGKRLETMNVAPGDTIKFHFFVSNFSDSDNNSVDGYFHPVANGLLELPIKRSNFDVECVVTYRKVPTDGSAATNLFTQVTSDLKLDLPAVREGEGLVKEGLVKYEFIVTVVLDNQIANTTSDDYFDAKLEIELFMNAISKE